MRQILCESCGKAEGKESGERMVLAASLDGEPAEYERVVWGTARTPRPDERVMRINDATIPLPIDFYICDGCSAEIRPGDRCAAWSVWAEGGGVRAWETEYLIPG